jgi:transcriptional antiterminator
MINAAEIVYYVIHMENDTFCMNENVENSQECINHIIQQVEHTIFPKLQKKRHIFLNNLLFFAIIVKIYGNMITVTIGKTYGVF